jgi:hypothetical protein
MKSSKKRPRKKSGAGNYDAVTAEAAIVIFFLRLMFFIGSPLDRPLSNGRAVMGGLPFRFELRLFRN